MNLSRHLWSVSPARAVAEALALGAALFLGVTLLAPQLPVSIVARGALLMVLAITILPALRARLPRGDWRVGLGVDLAVAVALSAGSLAVALGLTEALGLDAVADAVGGSLVLVILTACTGPSYLAFRLGVLRPWLFWNRLRRSRLVWDLTHAHLVVALVPVVAFVALLGLYQTLSSGLWLVSEPAPQGPLATVVAVVISLTVTVAGAAAVLGVFAVLAALVPAVAASFFVARRATKRLETLARATAAFQAGDYSVRVPVEGEDEVAQLQQAFNAMAADLERTLSELAAERDRVAGLLKARRELVASVSHELRTPVANIRGYLESGLARADGEIPPALRHDLAVVEQEAARLQALIDDLFALSRAEAGQLALNCAPTDVGELARRVVETAAPLAWRGGRVRLVAEVEPDVPPALVDAGRLEQVLANLLRNGVRHTPPGGIVATVVRADGDAVVVEVQDTGEGIDAADLPRVFERFYRGANRAEGEQAGAGLGLALVKELTEAMGGAVAARSAPGQGSTFTLRLPRA